MSVIAWDGRYLAADKASVHGDYMATTTKICRLDSGILLGWTGTEATGRWLANWFVAGADPAAWPSWQSSDQDWARLVVIENRKARFYEITPVANWNEEPFCAWGSGRDFAIGAMTMGASAVVAVEIASHYCATCGRGVDVIDAAVGEVRECDSR